MKTGAKESSSARDSSGRIGVGPSSVSCPEKSVQLLMLPPMRPQNGTSRGVKPLEGSYPDGRSWLINIAIRMFRSEPGMVRP